MGDNAPVWSESDLPIPPAAAAAAAVGALHGPSTVIDVRSVKLFVALGMNEKDV